jgi:hypothetical protein
MRLAVDRIDRNSSAPPAIVTEERRFPSPSEGRQTSFYRYTRSELRVSSFLKNAPPACRT